MKFAKRIAAFALAAVMVFSTLPMNALAVENPNQNTSGLCEHHTAHDEQCGYAPAGVETPCNHQHGDDCYVTETNCTHQHTSDCFPAEGVSDDAAAPAEPSEAEPTNCTHVCSEDSSCITKKLDCKHTHDEACGYTPATVEKPCAYVCEICNSQDSENAGQTPEDGGQEQCACITLCTEGNTNPDCPICGVEGADLTLCVGKMPDGVPGSQVDEAVKAVQDQINALPEADSITEENLESVKTQLTAIEAAKAALDESQQAALNMEKYNAAVERIAAIEENTQEAGNEPTENDVASVTIDGVTTYYEDLPSAFRVANGNTATIILLKSLTADDTQIGGIDSGNITLDMNGQTLSSNITSLYVDSGTLTITGGGWLDNVVNEYPRGGTVILESGTIHYISPDFKGKVIVKGGTIDNIMSPNATIEFEPGNLVLNKDTLSLEAGKSEQLTATVEPSISVPGFGYSWESSDTAVATVAADGTVTAVGAGTADITVTAGNKSQTCKVTVTAEDVASVTINGQTQNYTDLDDAAAAVSGTGGTLTLLKDVSGRTQPLELSGPMTFDLGGHTLSGSWDGVNQGLVDINANEVQVTNGKVEEPERLIHTVYVKEGATLSGDAEYYGRRSLGNKGIVSGGTFNGMADCYPSGTIAGGTFVREVLIGGIGKLQGGCFKDANMVIPHGIGKALAPGYVGYDNNGNVNLNHQMTDERFSFTGEVKAHTPHQSRWVEDKPASHTETGAKHEVCDICGYTGPSVTIPVIKHSFLWTANGNDTHTGTCSCGAVKTENCNYTDGKCSHCGYVDVAISLQPESLTVQEGEEAVFRITAAGDKLSYQWQKHGASSWEDIPGAAASSYTIPSASMEISGSQYRCVVFNDSGDSATSAAAILTVQKSEETENVITIELPTFDPVYAGYTQPDPKRITIQNSGTQDVTLTGLNHAAGNTFIVQSVAQNYTVPAGGSNTNFTVQPGENLGVGEHTATITAEYGNGQTATATVRFTVLPKPGIIYVSNDNTYYQGSWKDLTFVSNQPTERMVLSRTTVDGAIVPQKYLKQEDGDYAAVTLTNSFLRTLRRGSHTLTLYFSDGQSASATFSVRYSSAYDPTNPKTSDGIFLPLTILPLSAAALTLLLQKQKKSRRK